MNSGFKLLRIEYLFSVIIPVLFGIYLNNYYLLSHLDIIFAFAFWGITGNTLNDLKDMDNPDDKDTTERTRGYGKKEIAVISITGFILGTALFINPILHHPEIVFYLIAIAVFVILYCIVLKPLLVINWVILGVSHIWLPYFIVKINAGDSLNGLPLMEMYEWFLLTCFSIMALSANLIHEIIDEEAITKLSAKKQQLILWTISFIAIIFAIISLILFTRYTIYFFPFILFPIGVIYMARSTKTLPHGVRSIKNTGIVAGNMFFVFIIILIILQQIS